MIGALVLSASLFAGQTATPRVLVVPFETPARDGRTYWLGEAAALLMSDDLAARGVGAISRAARERAYEQLHLPPHTVLSRATVIKVGELVGATQVIVGEVRVDGDTLTLRARPIRIDVGRAEADVVEHGPLKDLFVVAARAARRVAPGSREPAAAPAPSIEAFEQYVRGLLAEQPATQVSFLEAAMKIDPSYDRARFALWEVRNAQGDHGAALAAAKALSPKYDGFERVFLESVSLIGLARHDEAFGLLKEMYDALMKLESLPPIASVPTSVLNNLGVVQIRRAAPPESGKPVYYLTKAAEKDSDNPDVLFNLGYAYALDKDPQAALYWLREALRRDPADADAHFILAAALEASGSQVEAARERELAGQLASEYADPAAKKDPLPRGLARVAQSFWSDRSSGGADQGISTTAQRDHQELARFHLERGRRLFDAEQDREATSELRRVIFLSPYEAEAHLLIGRIHLRSGRARDAVDALKISIWSRDTAPARVALADAYLQLKEPAAAKEHALKALALDPASIDAAALLKRIDGGGGYP